MSTETHEWAAGSGPGSDPAHPASGWHAVNVGHLVMGLALLGLVGVWALVQGGVVADGDVRWLLPVPWVVAGTAGLLALTLAGRRHTTRVTGWAGPGPGATAGSAEPTRQE